MRLNSIYSGKYFSSIFWSVSASGITFLSYPLLTMLYDISSFGVFGVTSSFAVIASSFVLLRFDYFVVASFGRFKIIRLLVVGCLIGGCFFVVGLIFVLVLSALDVFTFKLALCILILALELALYNIFLFYLVATKKIKHLNFARLCRSVMVVASQILMFFLFSGDGLVLGLMVGLLVTLAVMVVIVLPDIIFYVNNLSRRKLQLRSVVTFSLKVHVSDIRLQMPQTLINSILNNSLPIIVECLFGLAVAGAVLLIDKIIRMPVGIVVDTVRPLLISDFTRLNTVQSSQKLKRVFVYLGIAGAAIISIVQGVTFIPLQRVFIIWSEISYLASPMVTFAAAILISTPVFCFLLARGYSSYLFRLEVVRFALYLVLCMAFYFGGGDVSGFIYLLAAIFFVVPALTFLKIKSFQ